ncbi:WYL domain-containing protein [Clostridium sp. P21]|uniref:WYL domain-containing protein n=1 Tax=Clostridium muellerianum TaxID=2716538 RepID=A0A7Y0HNR9_9CLOT|nr:WYL domain-containing protein [Clostridium muellerianum]NMM63450.1 WYL domain-containing protein [Clostridium muellerianum]
MAEFSELIKNFEKIRDYMRDFYIYGFKARNDFKQKSSRTYDNERRRIESYLGDYIKWDNSRRGKKIFISLDSSSITENPLYSAWKSKSFTDNDIMLHFYILDLLKRRSYLSIEEITNEICEKSLICFDVQTVRIKVKEYVKEGFLTVSKNGKTFYYSLTEDYLKTISINYENIVDALMYYQEAAPFGVVGNYLLSNEDKKNNIFSFKHHFLVHTLEDNVLLSILRAIKEKRVIRFVNESKRLINKNVYEGVPLKIFASTQTGRRYINIYNENRKQFVNYRLDYVKSVKILDVCSNYEFLKDKLERNLDKCWGVSFGGKDREEKIFIKLYIDEEKESYIMNRINREGRGGKLEKVDKNIYIYSKKIFDTNEIMAWVKSFTGRIISIEGASEFVTNRFCNDMKRMKDMYLRKEE